jgi:hypothetical protein
MPRTLEKDGVNLAFKVVEDLRERVKSDALRHARRRKDKKGALRGPTYAMNALLLWYLRLDTESRARIQEEGRKLLEGVLAVGEGLGGLAEGSVSLPGLTEGSAVIGPLNEGPLNEGLDRPARTPRRRKASGSGGRKSG